MQQIDLPFLAEDSQHVRPHPGRRAPALWIARLLVLRAPRITEDAVLRDIRLRRGLNVLWAPPLAEGGDARLFDGRLTGHTAGKTTFCRLLRYLLGEERFASARGQERIRGKLPDGWVVAEIFLRDEPWIVGRPFGLGLHPFASRGVSVEEALHASPARGAYQDFLAALEASVISPIPVRRLPHDRRSVEWPLLLTWLARDQETRFAHLAAFRDPSSESQSPSPPLGERYALVRSVLGLMLDEESEIAQRGEALLEKRRQIEADAPVLAAGEAEDRRRLRRLLGLRGPDEGAAAGPLFATRLREALAQRRAALVEREATLAAREAEETEARAAWAGAVAARGAAEVRRAAAEGELTRLRDPREPASEARALEAEARESALAARADEVAAPLGSSPAGAAAPTPGLCRVPLTLARARGCPLAITLPDAEPVARALSAARQGVPAALDLGVVDHAALVRAADEAREASAAAARAEATQRERHARAGEALREEQGRLARDRAALGELERQKAYAKEAEEALHASQARLAEVAKEAQSLAELRAATQRERSGAIGRVSARFRYVVQALLGKRVGGEVHVTGGAIGLSIADQGEREGAAMETVKILAFDLATLTLGIEGQGYSPGFLLHDGPREADLDQGIYERLFLYAVDELEEAYRGLGEPAFQYIVTTTAPPPRRLARAPWLLEPRLDASVPEGRLFGMDL
jgi:hypothetical protein